MYLPTTLLALFTTAVLARNPTPFRGPAAATHKSVGARAPATDCGDPSSFNCDDCFGPDFKQCPDWELMCYHPDVGEELGCLDPEDPDFGDKMDEVAEKEGIEGDDEEDEKGEDKEDEKDKDKEDEGEKEEKGGDKEDEEKKDQDGAAAGLGPKGFLMGALGAGVLMVVM